MCITVPCMESRNLFLAPAQLSQQAGSRGQQVRLSTRWISIRISVQEEHPLGPVSGLHIPSPPDEQDCCGKNTDDPSEQDLYTSAEQGQRVETHCQGREKQWVPITS